MRQRKGSSLYTRAEVPRPLPLQLDLGIALTMPTPMTVSCCLQNSCRPRRTSRVHDWGLGYCVTSVALLVYAAQQAGG